MSRLLTEEENIHPILIEKTEGVSEQGSSSGGNSPNVLRLTEEGKLAYKALARREPVGNEYDRLIRCQSSPEHTILNDHAAEFLMEAGYLIKGQGQVIHLPNGGTFIPDNSVINPATRELIFVEGERDVHKDKMTRKQKWINL